MLATVLHLVIEFGPLLCWGTALVFADLGLGIFSQICIVLSCMAWFWVSMLILNRVGVVNPLFGMEMAVGLDRGLALHPNT